MSRNNIILAAIGGAAVAALLVSYFGSEKGKQAVNEALNSLKPLADKATSFAKENFPNFNGTKEPVQPS